MAFSCCGMEFRDEDELTRHQVKQHGAPRKVAGTCCGQEFFTEEGLDEHMRTVHGRVRA